MSLYSKLPRKHTSPRTFIGTVGSRTISAEGRTKREAEKRLRTAFAQAGLPTVIKNEGASGDRGPAYVDRLTIQGPMPA